MAFAPPQVERQYPLNLSILISGGKETNRDSLSSGERSGRSPSSESGRAPSPCPELWSHRQGIAERGRRSDKSPLEKGAREGDSPVHWSGTKRAVSIALLHLPQSRVVWECSPKRVVNPTQG